MQLGMSTHFCYLTYMSNKQELTEQEKGLLDLIAEMFVQVVLKEADANKEAPNTPEVSASE